MAETLAIHPHHLAQLRAFSASPLSLPGLGSSPCSTPPLTPSGSSLSLSQYDSDSACSVVTPLDGQPLAGSYIPSIDHGCDPSDFSKPSDPLVAATLASPPRRPALRVIQPVAPAMAPSVRPGGANMKRSYSLPVPSLEELEKRRKLVDADRQEAASPASAPVHLSTAMMRRSPASRTRSWQKVGTPTDENQTPKPAEEVEAPSMGLGLGLGVEVEEAPAMVKSTKLSVPASIRWGSTSTFTPSVSGRELPYNFPNPHGVSLPPRFFLTSVILTILHIQYSQSHLADHRPLNRSASYSHAELPGVTSAAALCVPSAPRRALSASAGNLLACAVESYSVDESALSDGSDTEVETDGAAHEEGGPLYLRSPSSASSLSPAASLRGLLSPLSIEGSSCSSPASSLGSPTSPFKRSGRVTVSPFTGFNATLASVPGSPSAPEVATFGKLVIEEPDAPTKKRVLGRPRTAPAL